MEDLKRFIFRNIEIIGVILIFILPTIINAIRLKRKAADRKHRPRAPDPASGRKPEARAEADLESKVRKFFEDIVVAETAPKPADPSPLPPPDEGRAAAPVHESVRRHMSLEERMEGDVPDSVLMTEAPSSAAPPVPPPVPEDRYVPNSYDEYDTFDDTQSLEASEKAPDYDVRNLHISDLVAAGLHFGSFQKLTRSELRRAIVLKEILDKPVAWK